MALEYPSTWVKGYLGTPRRFRAMRNCAEVADTCCLCSLFLPGTGLDTRRAASDMLLACMRSSPPTLRKWSRTRSFATYLSLGRAQDLSGQQPIDQSQIAVVMHAEIRPLTRCLTMIPGSDFG